MHTADPPFVKRNYLLEYLENKIDSPDTGSEVKIDLNMASGSGGELRSLYYLEKGGNKKLIGENLFPGSNPVSFKGKTGDYILVKEGNCDAYNGVYEIAGSGKVDWVFFRSLILEPNCVPVPPGFGPACIPAPEDTPRILVGFAVADSGSYLLYRTQNWYKTMDSITVGPGASREIKDTTYTGVTKGSATEEKVGAKLNMEAGASWGMISVKVSAELSASSDYQQTVSLTSYSERTVTSPHINHNQKQAEMILFWQLMDTLTIYSGNEGLQVDNQIPPSIFKSCFYDPN